MNIGIFTDTYFPQVSGVATSIKTLKEELTAAGHSVYIFTTSDPAAVEEEGVLRFPSVPLLSFKERRIVVRGYFSACQYGRELDLDVIHTQTEFGMGLLGKRVARKLGIPAIHTYHTMYEDYLHYIANGLLVKPRHVCGVSRFFTKGMASVVCPSQRVVDQLRAYDIDVDMKVVPTGIDINKFVPGEEEESTAIRERYGVAESDRLLLSLSRISFEKNIQGIIDKLPEIIEAVPNVKLMVVGDGPYLPTLKELVVTKEVEDHVIFTGEIPNDYVGHFYRAADLFVNASTSESQGLTYIEALAAGAKVIAPKGPYLEGVIDHPSLGTLYEGAESFVPTVIEYLKSEYSQLAVTDEIRSRKLQEISSDEFGKQIATLYKEAIVKHTTAVFKMEK